MNAGGFLWRTRCSPALLGTAFLLTALSSAATAYADEPAPSPPPADDSEQLSRATKLFWEAHSRFEQGEYAAALDLFQQTYAIRPEPEVLYNIAVTQQRLGQCEAARASYREYLEGADHRERAREQLEQLDQTCAPAPAPLPPNPAPLPPAAAAAPAQVQPPPQVLLPPVPPPADSAPEQPASMTTREILGWTSLGLATVALGTAIYFEVERRDEKAAYETSGQGDDKAEAYTKHNHARTLAWTTATAAGALAVTGGWLLLYDPNAATSGGSPRKLGFALSATGRF